MTGSSDAQRKSFLVIGAGIAGLATAVALQRGGHTVRVLEERQDTALGAGISIWPNALAALDEIGLGDPVREAGGRITAGALRWHDGTWLRRPSAQRMITALGEPLVVIQRRTLRDILVGGLAEGTVSHGVAVTAVERAGSGAAVRTADGTRLSADAVIGADGVNSVVARHLNGPMAARYVGYTAWRGVADVTLDPDLAGETLGAGTEVGHVPLGSDRTYWFATQRLPEGHRCPGGELAYLRAKFAGWADPVPAVLAATAEDAVLRNDLYDRAPARTWAAGPVVLVGDAAHPMRPHLGQGGCQGVEDAAILAHLVGDGRSDLAAAFARYAAFRRPRLRRLVWESRTVGRVVNLRPALLSAAASRATVLVPEAVLTRHLAGIAAGSAFRLPPG
ncbi:FAD-dependent monooxygenase [[Mycobacterium] wendilense]|uniref:FAD-dependent monooxygenase n=1 Tax=[Mycobacterium] wendilense TaxID=3064284 RepID=A0ABN9NY21_9MYCO|nr:FAD-dependent monooxygenase [Mycolicibacterium sp. MU0050]CAJ1581590.1 FAD-dependent monooxygenase [Mycolicibacterium sp. MU0050]